MEVAPRCFISVHDALRPVLHLQYTICRPTGNILRVLIVDVEVVGCAPPKRAHRYCLGFSVRFR